MSHVKKEGATQVAADARQFVRIKSVADPNVYKTLGTKETITMIQFYANSFELRNHKCETTF